MTTDTRAVVVTWWRAMRMVMLAGVPVGVLVGGVGSRLAMLALRVSSPEFVRGIGSTVQFVERRAVPGGWHQLVGPAPCLAAGPAGALSALVVAPGLLAHAGMRTTSDQPRPMPSFAARWTVRVVRPATASLHVVLALLGGELHGYALMRRVGELSDGAVKMGPGTLYGTLNRLVDAGLVVETTDRVERGESRRRRYYELTATGRAVALAEFARLQALVHRVTGRLAGGVLP